MSNFSRGSEWRKWDLHVHTPESEGYSGDWESFKKQLKDSDCELIGINDYCSISGYKKLIREIESGSFNLDKKLLPVVEFRMSDSVQNKHNGNGATHFNFHIVFNDSLNIEDVESMIKGLDSNGSTIGSDYTDKKKIKEKKINFKELIKKLNLDEKFKNNFLVWLPYDEYGGIDQIDPNSDSWIKSDFIKKSNILGSSRKSQIDFFLWKSDKFTEDQFKQWFPKKPCVKGSDSHNSSYPIGKLKNQKSEPCENYCWIKADLSFEGLKQIVYEPEERVKIQPEKPDTKIDYYIIDSFQFIDKNFIESKICLNSNLVSIIGDKSTGKSILLRSIARTIDPLQVEQRYDKTKISKKEDPKLKILWKDGKTDDSEQRTNRKIIYIPQTFLNEHIDKKSDLINGILFDFLIQHPKFKSEIENIQFVESEISSKITGKINNIFNVKSQVNQIKKQISEIGNKDDIAYEITKLSHECDILQKQGGASEDDLKNYNILNDDLTSDSKNHSKSIVKLRQLNEILKNYDDIDSSELISIHLPYFNKLDYELKEILEASFVQITETNKYAIKLILNSKVNELIDLINKLKDSINENRKKIQPLQSKINFSDNIKAKNALLVKEKSKLDQINQFLDTLSKLETEYNKSISDFVALILNYSSELEMIKEKLPEELFKEVKFKIEVVFNEERFKTSLTDFLNIKQFSKFKENSGIDLNDFKYQSITFKDSFAKIIKGILNEELMTKSKKTQKDVLIQLSQNFFEFKYNIEEGGDLLEDMSPGKRGFVLLKVLIDLDDSKWPILIDQPEDDLDSKSISKELVEYMKKKKKERQIIIVSHDPNLVLGADSEQIIVANQHGTNSKNKEKQFEYIGGSIENTYIKKDEEFILYSKGIQEHICEILEGGADAFKKRRNKYNIILD